MVTQSALAQIGYGLTMLDRDCEVLVGRYKGKYVLVDQDTPITLMVLDQMADDASAVLIHLGEIISNWRWRQEANVLEPEPTASHVWKPRWIAVGSFNWLSDRGTGATATDAAAGLMPMSSSPDSGVRGAGLPRDRGQ